MRPLDGVVTVHGDRHTEAAALEAAAQGVAAWFVVFDEQNSWHDASRVVRLLSDVDGRLRLGGGIDHDCRQADHESRSVAGAARDRHGPAHQFAKARHNREAEAGAAVLASRGDVGLREWLKHLARLFSRHADARVGDAELHAALAVYGAAIDFDRDRAIAGELAGVAEQVE